MIGTLLKGNDSIPFSLTAKPLPDGCSRLVLTDKHEV